jgi:hypothetical protein
MDIWRRYHALIENYARMVRGGGRWDELGLVLNRAITSLSYDLVVLQANYVIDRGLRGEEALRVFWDEATKILEEVTSAWRAICEQLAVTFEDDAKETKEREQPFHRVRDDLRRLLHDMPPEAAGEIALAADTAAEARVAEPEHNSATTRERQSPSHQATSESPEAILESGVAGGTPTPDADRPANEVPGYVDDIEKRKAERRRLRDDYKAECRRKGLKVTDEMIAEAACKTWHSRFQVQKWLACDSDYDGEPDRLIRKVFADKPHLQSIP